jgi:membrane-bound lytic murein transglycosylase D
LKKFKHIAILGLIGFFLIQVAKAAGIEQGDFARFASFGDTTVKKDSVIQQVVLNDNKQFKSLLQDAFNGSATGAKLNPMAVSFVESYVSRNKNGFLAMKGWAKPYFDMMDEVLTQHGVPKELKYLAVIESGLKYNAISWAGACGPWAFMPAAAVDYGLNISRGNDERMDYYKSTHAAARLLTDLYKKYGNWLLVVAAYNCGPGNMDRAIRKAGGNKDFWVMQYSLPGESMNHVKKFIGTHYIFEGGGGITTVTQKEMKDVIINGSTDLKEEEIAGTTAYNITGRFNADVIIKHIKLDKKTFDKFNPGFSTAIAVDGKYNLRLPIQKMNVFVEKRYEILDESMKLLLETADGTK